MKNPLPTIVITGIYIDINYNWNPISPYISDIKLNSPGYIKNNKNLDLDGLKI